MFDEEDYLFLKDSLTCARLFYLKLVTESISDEKLILLKEMVGSYERELKKEWTEDLSYNSEEIMKSVFFENFVRKN